MNARIDQLIRAAKGKPMLLYPPKEAVLFEDGDRVVLDLSKFTKLGPIPAPGREKLEDAAPFIGPQWPPPGVAQPDGSSEPDQTGAKAGRPGLPRNRLDAIRDRARKLPSAPVLPEKRP